MNKKEKAKLRQQDRTYFYRALGHRYLENKEIDHDWQNGCYCRILSHKEHILIGRKRGEGYKRKKYI